MNALIIAADKPAVYDLWTHTPKGLDIPVDDIAIRDEYAGILAVHALSDILGRMPTCHDSKELRNAWCELAQMGIQPRFCEAHLVVRVTVSSEESPHGWRVVKPLCASRSIPLDLKPFLTKRRDAGHAKPGGKTHLVSVISQTESHHD
jgi:hypothetical protein